MYCTDVFYCQKLTKKSVGWDRSNLHFYYFLIEENVFTTHLFCSQRNGAEKECAIAPPQKSV